MANDCFGFDKFNGASDVSYDCCDGDGVADAAKRWFIGGVMDFSFLICDAAIAAATAFESGMECMAFAVAVIWARYENAAAVSNGTADGTMGN